MTYVWTAYYNDGLKLEQYKDGKENLFGNIDQEKLTTFTIVDDSDQICVDLTNGTFSVNGNIFKIARLSYLDVKYRLIYFRRVSVSIGTSPGMEGNTVKSHIGFQVTINNKNHKVILSEDGEDFQIDIS